MPTTTRAGWNKNDPVQVSQTGAYKSLLHYCFNVE
jgi:hypothetical protein